MKKIKSKLPIEEIGGALAGAIATGLVKKVLDKSAPDLDPKIKSIVITGAGAFLAMQKSGIMKGAGIAMVSVGGMDLVNAFMPGALSGVDDIFLSAPADQSILSLPADQSILSAPDEFSMNAPDEFSMNGEEYLGEDYQINGEE